MERKLNVKRVVIVAALAVALLAIIGACIAVFVSHGKGKKSENQPLLCEEPVFPATIKAAGGEYTRKLSTYWYVWDVKNGKVIIEDVNRFKGAKEANDDLGVTDLQGRVLITCDNREIHFTGNGYIETQHYGKDGSHTYNYFNMGGNCLATLDSLTDEAKEKYEGEAKSNTADSAKMSEEIDGWVRYTGKYAIVSQSENVGIEKGKKNITCVYEYKAAG
ncbi:MAG: hypothetical protein Q4A05_10715 [Ruminococcus sp.]|nr:hypothetical protein [Ruminococcus sp.]